MKKVDIDLASLSPEEKKKLAERLAERLKKSEAAIAANDLAIVGIGCRFPGNIVDTESFWKFLSEGKDGITPIPPERWNLDEFSDVNDVEQNQKYMRWGGFLNGVDQFDPQFFGISPSEAQTMDPQQRIFLETVWEALENAGIPPKSVAGSDTGVFVGVFSHDYENYLLRNKSLGMHTSTGSNESVIAGRVSYTLGLQGPAISLNTACSSSLVALHLAAQSIRNNECKVAIVGGVNLILSPELSIIFANANMMSPEGRCKTFDAAADGYVRSEGCGVVIVKKLAAAIEDGDQILALIKGSAVNQDGKSSSLTAPSGPAQEKVVQRALQNAGLKPSDISYVEAHGTGTPLGDPLEMFALGTVFQAERKPENPLVIGSIKTNIGHTESAAGIAGVIKTALALGRKQIPPHLHFNSINPNISLERIPAVIPTKLTEWKPINGKRFAGVSSFGYSGTNAHVILGEAPEVPRKEKKFLVQEASNFLLQISAKTEAALQTMAIKYANHLQNHPEQKLGDITYTAGKGRSHFEERLAVVGGSHQEMISALKSFGETGEVEAGIIKGKLPAGGQKRKLVFLFSGQGSQYPGMGKELYGSEPVFKKAIDDCAAILNPLLKSPLTEILFNSDSDLINQTENTQPCLFAVEYALSELWKSWGIVPQAVMGHSVGEYVAATVAGVFSLEDGLKLIHHRARLMQSLPGKGEMVAAMASEDEVKRVFSALPETTVRQVSIAAINGPESVVVAGYADAISEVVGAFEKKGIKTKPLKVSHAFHSPQLDGMLSEFGKICEAVKYNSPSLPMISNLNGKFFEPNSSHFSKYWTDHARGAVRFFDGMKTLEKEGYNVFLEVGPGSTLSGMARLCVTHEEAFGWATSIGQKVNDSRQILQGVGDLFVNGIEINWDKFCEHLPVRSKISLPVYSFQKKRYWLDVTPERKPVNPAPAQNEDHYVETVWKEIENLIAGKGSLKGQRMLLIGKSGQLLTDISEEFLNRGAEVVLASVAKSDLINVEYLNGQLALPIALKNGFNPLRIESYNSLFATLDLIKNEKFSLNHVIHMLGVSNADMDNLSSGQILDLVQFETGSAVALGQAILKLKGNVPRMSIVTWQAAGSEFQRVNVNQSCLWGLGRVLAIEHPELECLRLDISNSKTFDANYIDAICNEIVGSREEAQVALRIGPNQKIQRLVPRMKKIDASSLQSDAQKTSAFRDDATYLITGGLGGLGLKIAHWMAKTQGVKHIVLTGRKDPSAAVKAQIDQIRALGADVRVFMGDVSKEEDVNSIIFKIQETMRPLKGIVHAAGVIENASFVNQNWSNFEKVMQPKVQGTWNLHQATKSMPLDFFVMFSSIASMLGEFGMANYAAANAWMDGFANFRKSRSLPALSINWGAWAEVGMVSNLSTEFFEKQGLTAIHVDTGIRALGKGLLSSKSNFGFIPADWERYVAQVDAQSASYFQNIVEVNKQSRTRISVAGGNEFLERLSTLSAAEQLEEIGKFVHDQVVKVLALDANTSIDRRAGLMSMGMDSLLSIEFQKRVKKHLGEEYASAIPKTLIFDYPNIEGIVKFLAENVLTPEKVRSKSSPKKTEVAREPIAIVGMSCRFPGGANNLESFWSLLANGRNAITEIPRERWDVDKYFDSNQEAPGMMYVKKGGFISDVDKFDPQFFGIAPSEAVAMDPQQRLLLELTWEALENANESPQKVFDSNTGVFVGIASNDYLGILKESANYDSLSMHSCTGTLLSVAAGRVAYAFGFRGPTMSIDTACSSSLVAIDAAVKKLQDGSCDRAVVGGVNLIVTPEYYIALSKMHALSPEGICKTFDESADGYARSEGCGVLVLKRLSEAVANRDHIWAVIRGSAVNQDGRSSSLTAPNGSAQVELLREALANADVKAADVSYFEAHGTGTPLGDPIEIGAIGKVLSENRNKENSLVIGTVKTNIGHTENASGMAGVIKTVLAMNHKQIPPHLHFKKLNPSIDLASIPAVLPLNLMEWKPINGKRIAGVSSFGFSGTNAHVVLEEAPTPTGAAQDAEAERPGHVLCISAKEEGALRELSSRYAMHLEERVEQNLEDICYTAGVGRSHLEERLAIVGKTREELVSLLKRYSESGEGVAGVVRGTLPPGSASAKVAFLFSGQGSQYAGMGKELYEKEPVFKKAIDTCGRILEKYLKTPLTEVLFKRDSDLIHQTEYTQPCLFAIEYALSELWRSWGITPQAVMGHSVGEYVAATVSGAMSLEDGLKLISTRSKLMQALTGHGEMAAISVSEVKVKAAIESLPATKSSQVSIAAVNGPESVVISGYSEVVREVARVFENQKMKVKLLKVSHGFHSPQMDGMLDAFEKVASEIQYKKPKVRVVSNLNGNYVEGYSAKYWRDHVREAVRFNDGMQTLYNDGYRVFLEVGPHPVLSSMGKDCVKESDSCGWALSLKDKRSDVGQILEGVGTLYAHGVDINWEQLCG